MLDQDEGRRSKWSTTAINVDHPLREKEMVRDNTIRTAGLTTNTTGWHADVILADDVVVPDNAYTEEGRRKCAAAMSQMSSIKNAGGMMKAAGTRYHPGDQYNTWLNQEEALYNDNDEITGYTKVWQVMEEVVEIDNVFTWPREARTDGKRFGFDRKVLARIYAEYTDKTQFHAQYYNNPNDPESNRVDRSRFQYYDQKFLKQSAGYWYFKEKRLNVYAGVDFAFSLSKKSDYTAIVVLGVDEDNDIYILDIDRFKSDKISEYYDRLVAMYNKWEFKKLRAEVTVAQQVIVNDLKQRFKEGGISLKIDEFRPSRVQGSKEERIAAVLEPRYQQQAIWHYRGGYTPVLEDEIILARPPHDDIVDTLASIVEVAQKPRTRGEKPTNVVDFASTYNRRFGGFGTTFGGTQYGR
jgi:phage terminase large subunit-like protein